jgi:3-methyladenine DNA glycosylase AlkD
MPSTNTPHRITANQIEKRLRSVADPAKACLLQRFFKTGPGEYGEDDRFLGIMVPVIRKLVKEYQNAPLTEAAKLLRSPFHEARLLALLLMVKKFEKGDDAVRKDIYTRYLGSTKYINNWDLVDLSAPNIVGAYLNERSRAPLYRLVKSKSLWERRIAILATASFIRQNDFGDTLLIAKMLLDDGEDLIHKATGWMLREVGKRDTAALESFLKKHAPRMPRTMLRYAIERFPEQKRKKYLALR